PEFCLGPGATDRAARWLAERGLGGGARLAALAPGAAHATKRWPVAHWSALAERLGTAGYRPVIVGGPDDRGLAQQLAAAGGVGARDGGAPRRVSPAPPPAEDRLIGLVADAVRRPQREGLFALWLVVRSAEALLPPQPVSGKNHRRRLQALDARLASLALPGPLKRALAAARQHLEPATPAAAALVLSDLVAPTREVLGPEA